METNPPETTSSKMTTGFNQQHSRTITRGAGAVSITQHLPRNGGSIQTHYSNAKYLPKLILYFK